MLTVDMQHVWGSARARGRGGDEQGQVVNDFVWQARESAMFWLGRCCLAIGCGVVREPFFENNSQPPKSLGLGIAAWSDGRREGMLPQQAAQFS